MAVFATGPCVAQSRSPDHDNSLRETFECDSGVTSPVVDDTKPNSSAPAVADPPPSSADDNGSEWHFDMSPYIWLPGVHGTIGALGRDSSLHATPRDLIANFRFGLMGTVDVRRKWLLLPIDMMWVRLGDSKALPFPSLEATNADVKAEEFIFTPKVGVRVLNQERLKIDVLTGIRYWHFSENVRFIPSNLNLNFSASQNWVDPLVGGRITGAFGPKIVTIIFGDVGGWATGSQLGYQFGGILGYRIEPNLTMQAGHRYLFVNYRNGGATIQMVTSGVLVGLTFNQMNGLKREKRSTQPNVFKTEV
jgi:hypothetical protein